MRKRLLLFWFCSTTLLAEPVIRDARQLLAQQPAEVVRIYQQVLPGLHSSPAWLQRDWYLLATRAYLQLRNWSAAEQALQLADASLVTGLSAAEIALLGGTLSYHRQQSADAWFWYRCADSFSSPPETRARILLNLGVMASRQQQLEQAFHYYQQGLQLAQAHEFKQLLPMYYNNLGLWYWRNGILPEAEHMLRKALYQHSRLSGSEAQARAMVNLLLVLASDRQWDKFNRYLREANVLVRRQANPDYLQSLTLLLRLQQYQQPDTLVLPEEIIGLAAALQSSALRQSVAMLLQQFDIHWQAPTPAPSSAAELVLPNSRLQCAQIEF